MNTKNQITETKAIEMANSILKPGFTVSLMSLDDAEDFIWGYLYDNGLQYQKPIEYINDNGFTCVALVYQEG